MADGFGGGDAVEVATRLHLNVPGSPTASISSTDPLVTRRPVTPTPTCFSFPASLRHVEKRQVETTVGRALALLCGWQPVVRKRRQHLFVMRHAERADVADPDWAKSADRPWDPPLSEWGRYQAYQVGTRLRREGWGITRVVCSPYLRCVQTAVEVAAALQATNDEDYAPAGPCYSSSSGPAPGQVAAMARANVAPARSLALQQHIMGCMRNPDTPAKSLQRKRKFPGGEAFGNRRIPIRMSLDYGLCETMNSAEAPPPASQLLRPRHELEALFPPHTRDVTLPMAQKKPPTWPEDVGSAAVRLVNAMDRICDQLLEENVLIITHAEAVHSSVLRCNKKANVYNLMLAGYVHLERSVYADREDEEDRGVGSWTLVTRSGNSGVFFV